MTKHRNSAPGINSHHFLRTSCRKGEKEKITQLRNKGMFPSLTIFCQDLILTTVIIKRLFLKRNHKTSLTQDIGNRAMVLLV